MSKLGGLLPTVISLEEIKNTLKSKAKKNKKNIPV
jgi:hypothetical protein